MDKLLKYLLEGKSLLEAEDDVVDDTYELADEDPDVFDKEEPKSEDPSDEPEVPEVGEQEDLGKVEEVEEEEITKEYIGQEGDNHYYLEPNKEGNDDSASKWVITNQLGEVVFDSAEQNITNTLDFILAAKDELKLTMWTDEVFKKHFLPAITAKDEPSEMDLTEPEVEPEPTDEPEDETPSDEEDIFMEPEEELEESKINEFLNASFKFDGADHKISLIEDHTTRSSIFEIDGIRHKFTPDVTNSYRVEHGKFTKDSLGKFGEFIYSGMKESDRVEL